MTKEEVIRAFVSNRTRLRMIDAKHIIAASDKLVLLYVDGDLDTAAFRSAIGELEAHNLLHLKRRWYVNGKITYANNEDDYQRVDTSSAKIAGRGQFRRTRH